MENMRDFPVKKIQKGACEKFYTKWLHPASVKNPNIKYLFLVSYQESHFTLSWIYSFYDVYSVTNVYSM